MIKIFIFTSLLFSSLFSLEISDFINPDSCGYKNIIINKQVYSICYNTSMKGPKYVGYRLDGSLVNKNNIQKRPRFYTEKKLPKKYRVKPSDFTYTGTQRGHMANHASFDYDTSVLRKTYSMANISPQYPKINYPVWSKAEQAERSHAKRLGYVNVINIVLYDNPTNYLHRISLDEAMASHPDKKSPYGKWSSKRIKKYYRDAKKLLNKKIVIPSQYVKIIWNDDKNFMKCYLYDNNPLFVSKGDKLKHHLVNCDNFLF
jgi:endonuclease G